MSKIFCMLIVIMAISCIYTTAGAATYTYDALNRLVKVVYGDGSNTPLSYIEYTYDSAGNITRISSLGGVLYGDVDGSESVDLADAIVSLQIISGQDAFPPPFEKSEVNSDQRIGMEEAIYILQKLAQ